MTPPPRVYEPLENISIALSYYGWLKARLPQRGPTARPPTQRYTPDQIPPSSWPLSPCCSALEGIRKHNSHEVLTEHPGRRPPPFNHLPRASCSHSGARLHSDTCVSGGGRSAAHRPAVKPAWGGEGGGGGLAGSVKWRTAPPRHCGLWEQSRRETWLKQKVGRGGGEIEESCLSTQIKIPAVFAASEETTFQ